MLTIVLCTYIRTAESDASDMRLTHKEAEGRGAVAPGTVIILKEAVYPSFPLLI